jgi:hypothetical protein
MTRSKSLCLFWLVFACSGENLDLGYDVSKQVPGSDTSMSGTGGTGGTAGTPPGGSTWPPQSGCVTDPSLAALIGTWDGELEDFFLKPLEHVHLVIDGASSDGFCGSFTWGDKPPFPLADDPNALYPPADNWQPFGWGGAANQALPPVEGFPYTITDSGERLPTVRLGITQSEPWRSWCGIQTPVADAGTWTCDHVCRDGSNEDVTHQFLCGACDPQAGAVCVCDQSSCGAVQSSKQSFDLTLSADGKTLTGPFQPAPAMPASSWETVANASFYLTRLEQ